MFKEGQSTFKTKNRRPLSNEPRELCNVTPMNWGISLMYVRDRK